MQTRSAATSQGDPGGSAPRLLTQAQVHAKPEADVPRHASEGGEGGGGSGNTAVTPHDPLPEGKHNTSHAW